MVFVLEVLGLGLGVAPLMIEFLKANPAPVHAIGALRRESAHDSMDDFYINLGYEMAMFRITLRKLVKDLPIDGDTKAKLMGDTTLDSSIWKRPSHELRQCLERRLSPCLETFEQCMEKILCLLAKLVKDSTLPIPISEGQIRVFAGRYYEKLETVYDSGIPLSQRFKFGWRKDKREKLLSKISKYNRKLQQMLERTSTTTPSYSSVQPTASLGCIRHLGLRKRMAELCQAIRKVWCDCSGQHELRFGLHQDEIDEAHITLDMLMNLSNDNRSFKWGESKMKIYLQRESESPANTMSMSPLQPHPQGRRHSSWTGATFVDSPQNSPAGETAPSMSSFAPNPDFEVTNLQVNHPHQEEDHIAQYPNSSPINSMCRTFTNYQRRRRKSEIIFRDKELLHRQLDTDSVVRHSHPGITLVEYLQKTQKWTLQDRKTLQVLLAHSIIFFPWKGSDLNKSAIAFHHGSSGRPLDRPFAALKPGHGANDVAAHCSDRPEDSYRPYPNETLAALATILLEIELQKPIEAMITEDDEAETEMETHFWATTRILREQKGNIYDHCWSSIEACLRCDFTEEEATLDDKAFLEQVYERVIAPLEHELWNGFHIRLPGTDGAGHTAGPVTSIAAEMEVKSMEKHGPRKTVRIVGNASSEDVPSDTLRKGVRLAVQVNFPRTGSDSGSAAS